MLNKKFRKKYRNIFERDPLAANLFFLLCELAGPDGKVILPNNPEPTEQELRSLLIGRFEDPFQWQL